MKKIIITALTLTSVAAMAQWNPMFREKTDPGYIKEIVINDPVNGRRFVVVKSISLSEPMFIFHAFEIDCQYKTFRWLNKGTPRTLQDLKSDYTDQYKMMPWGDPYKLLGEVACEAEKKK